MKLRSLPAVLPLTLVLIAAPGVVAAQAADPPTPKLPPAASKVVDYARDVAPLLSRSCYPCHGEKKHKGGLALHVQERLMAGGDEGPIVVVGKSAESRLIQSVARTDPDYPMPPEGEGDPLTAAEVGLLRAWIDQGAKWSADGTDPAKSASIKSDHWSFQPPKRTEPPAVKHADWPRNPIDRFILARLEKEGLEPSPEADRPTLIRRLSLDLIGLPPSPAEIDAFVADVRPDAYEQLVDRLLASPQHGEAWGRHWLDRARYADTNGYEKDRERSIWPYRDWVVRAINRDMPFNQFTIEQLAGDLLPNPTADQLTATGFHRNTMINEEGGIDVEEFRFAATVDRVATTGAVWLGLTVGCAQCHTHKYDPITHREFYSLFAFLNNADEPEIEVPNPAVAVRRAAIETEAQRLEANLETQYPAEGPESLSAKRAAWEKTLHPAHWTILKPTKLVSRKHATLTVQPDGSVLASGDKPNNDVYEVEVQTDQAGISAVRLEVLPDPSLPDGGPGRAPLFLVGDFLLTEFQAAVVGADGKAAPLKISKATEDYAASSRSAALAIDGVTDTGWGVNGQIGKPHAAVFELERSPDVVAGRPTTLKITMNQEFIHQTTIGRFRLSVTTDARPVIASGVPADVEDVLLVDPAKRTDDQRLLLTKHYLAVAPELAKAREPIAKLRQSAPHLATTMVMQERRAEHARTTNIHKRGEFMKLGDEVGPGVPAVLHPLPQGAPLNRLTLARWLVDDRNPLVGRVVANQLWQTYFGRGLVSTPEDFGVQGARPTHPELLDWLATELPRQGWSLKAMHRAIVTSATYRQRSNASADQIARDPINALLARGPRFRVGAETIRDVALAASGLLAPMMGGPSVHPPQPDGVTALAYGQEAWPTSVGRDRYRRGLYTFLKRTSPYASFITMDAPTSDTTCVRRERSNTPLQALTMLNDAVFVEAAQALARRIVREAPAPTAEARIVLAFRLCMGRAPRPEELSRITAFYGDQLARLRGGELDASKIAGAAKADVDGADLNELAAWTTVARVLLNLDETVTKE
ncbi:MAG: PSD1 and planctomycete cytochrome C domain-containing protein [Paludisphaera borealis]|uniref:PSD1 and planctomycete cytochrome C domain-containing protein n=1 Tax=Paludisphaera borealis TaxID=1387353 RepID=UPI00284794B0|nr:PSD1 and planctomycete cytochrome C domain-containing protein [Paludisphaera borealis]MDR3618362.1 PSD1 and planctomycete cytochrome C domain-containing protein [Paludisphaera borealis]